MEKRQSPRIRKHANRLCEAKGVHVIPKKVTDLIRKWHADGMPISYICKQTGLTEQHVKAIIKNTTVSEEWKKKIFSNH
ncbi:hypothetical protein [Gardnerella vaginalis]|uniref:hypothetical protein n=1 Tax=Gardnerella vaginalis TaxID=2702 RepID=UPI0039EE4FA8